MVQFIAFFGSIIFNYIAKAIGAKNAVLFSLLIWIGALVYIYAYVQSEFQFYLLAAVIAVVLGGSQALSRSIYSQMIPKNHAAQYFSLYEISDKGTSWLGPLLFGLAYQFTGNYRVAILSLVVFFIVGFLLLSCVKLETAIIEADNETLIHTE
jgi:MFS transporter, UMF1 family